MYVKLQSVLEEERKAVISRDFMYLYEVLSAKDPLLAGLSSISARRVEAVSSLLEKKGQKAQKGLKALMALSAGKEKSALKETAGELSEAMERVAELNKSNHLLIAESLSNLGRSLDFLEAFFVRGTYQSTGLVDGKAVKGARLRKGV